MKIDFEDDDFEIIDNPGLKKEPSTKQVDASFIVHFGIVVQSRELTRRLDPKEERTKLPCHLEQPIFCSHCRRETDVLYCM